MNIQSPSRWMTKPFSSRRDIIKENGEFVGADGLSAYQIALNHGFIGTEEEWLASLSATHVILNKSEYTTEEDAIAYMNSQNNTNVAYFWDDKLYCYSSVEEEKLVGACLYGYRNNASSGFPSLGDSSILIIPLCFSITILISLNNPYQYNRF